MMDIVSEKHRRTREKYAKKKVTNEKLLLGILFILFFTLIFAFKDNMAKASNNTDDITAMISPLQKDCEKQVPFVRKINGVNAVVVKLAEYQIAGRVVETYDYTSGIARMVKAISGKEYYNEISSKDVAISYGPLVLSENHNKIHYIMSGSRKIMYAIKDNTLIDEIGDLKTIGRFITNNHLIAENDEVEKLIKMIQKDDFVKITGSLVRVDWKNGIYQYEVESSMSREDIGNGACEVILVEDVKWIK